jgi:hypothetical protein
MRRRPRKLGPAGRPLRLPVMTAPEAVLPDAALDYYWHPEREGVEHAPADFLRDLKSIDLNDRVRVVRPPPGAPLLYKRAWLLWYRNPRVTHYLSPGWLMLCEWRGSDGEPLSLDQRVFSFLYSRSAKEFGNGRKYWQHCVSERNREKAAMNKIHTDGNHDRTEDYRQFMKIKNIGAGNKSALHDDGTVVPSRGQANWLAERRKRMIPGDVARAEARQHERQREAGR